MGVQVDEPGGDDTTIGIDGARRRFVDVTDDNDATITHSNIGTETGRTGSVDDDATTDHEIEH